MRGRCKTVLILITYIALANCKHIGADNEITVDGTQETVEDKQWHTELKIKKQTQFKKGRILPGFLPYNLENRTEEHVTDDGNKEFEKVETENGNKTNDGEKQNTANGNKEREARFLLAKYPQSPIADLMMQTVAVNYSPTNPTDPFDFLRDSYPLPKGYTAPLDEYDYIIIGAGSAGSVLASRLTEDRPKAMVLVIEAGKPEMLLTDIPAMVPYMQRTDYAWQYSAEQQPGICLGSDDQRCFLPRGKAVGGTSVTNYMLYTRGRREDWDRIAADGNYGWSYNDVLQYYLKSEKANLKRLHDPNYHNCDGDLSVENVPFRTGLVEAFLDAGRKTGSPTVDYNSPDQFGFGYAQTTTASGHRMSSARAFLHPHKRRKNLHILPETRATKILIEPQTKRAYGVEYVRNGKKQKVRCRREVILSAGPFASPQLLMLSGVGPQAHLQSLGIPVIKDSQVGRTLYDHISFPGVIFQLSTNNASLLEPKIATLPNLIQWMQFGEGLMTSASGIEGIGYIKTSVSDDPELVPDIELISLATSLNVDSGKTFVRSWGVTHQTYNSAFSSLNGKDTWSAVPMLLHPKSKGYIELRDSNPYSNPKVVTNFLSDPRDMATLKESIKHIIQLAESDAFRKYNPRLHLGSYHTCRTLVPGSDEYWDCAIRTLMISLSHPIGTCKMGPPSDPEAVVDPELRVYGVEGLRVIDSSVIPRTISAHTNAPAIMIGERGADLVKNTWINVVSK